jgi:MOSC domain-containing protein YiiM
MQAVTSVEALADCGLLGDRYTEAANRKSPDYQVSLIELENIEEFVQVTGRPLSPEMPRRNIVTRGVRLNELCGQLFTVGGATFEGLELCRPCRLFAERTHREVVKFFLRKGGLRARIVSGGHISLGARIAEDA